MKTIQINGEEFQYSVKENSFSGAITKFFSMSERLERKYFIGKKIKKRKTKEAFFVNLDIDAPYYSKEFIKDIIEKAHKNWKKR